MIDQREPWPSLVAPVVVVVVLAEARAITGRVRRSASDQREAKTATQAAPATMQ